MSEQRMVRATLLSTIERQLSCPVPRQLTWPVDGALFAFFK